MILVTGGAGFIGSYIVDKLIERGEEVRIFDSLDPQVHPGGEPPAWLNPEGEFVRGDVRDYESLRKAMEGVGAVFHMAAAVGVGQSQYQIKHYTDVSIGGTANLLDILANHPNIVKKVLVAASMSSYGEGPYACGRCGRVRPPLRSEEQMAAGDWEVHCPLCGEGVNPVPTREEDAQNCNSIYAITKKVQEDMILNVGRTYNIPSVALRLFNVYGPRQSLSNPYTGVAAIFMSRIKNGKPPLIFEDGGQTRDLVSVQDVVRAFLLALDGEGADYRPLNIGSGSPISIKDLALLLAHIYRNPVEPEIPLRFRKGDVRHCYADLAAARKLLKYETEVSIEAGLRELAEWSETAAAEDRVDDATRELEEKGLLS